MVLIWIYLGISSESIGSVDPNMNKLSFHSNIFSIVFIDKFYHRWMNTLVRCPDGLTCCQVSPSTDTIDDIKRIITSKRGIPCDYQNIYHQGKMVGHDPCRASTFNFSFYTNTFATWVPLSAFLSYVISIIIIKSGTFLYLIYSRL